MKQNNRLICGFLAIFLIFTRFNLSLSTSPTEEDNKLSILSDETYGGDNDEYAYDVANTSDGGIIVAGFTTSIGAGAEDGYLIKLDRNGKEQWVQTIGGTESDVVFSVIETSDGGFATAGLTGSYGNGGWDAWLVKLDGSGEILWNKTFGYEYNDYFGSLALTQDGGYILAGYNESSGVGERDILLIKTDAAGNLEWNKTYGSNYSEHASYILPTEDGGYLIAGVIETALCWGCQEVILLKIDGSGNQQWGKIIGGSSVDIPYSIIPAHDEGYLIAGRTESYGAGLTDVWLVKVDENGGVEWNSTYGGQAHDYANDIIKTADNGYVIAGRTESFGEGGEDAWILKVNITGQLEYNQTFGGPNNDAMYGIVELDTDKYALAGRTNSFGSGENEVWVLFIGSSQYTKGIPGYSVSIIIAAISFISLNLIKRIKNKRRLYF